mmetsp:Transcript_7134/g.26706  ORF Transcript_7134/g.26706 Transcript_7134/m.26706 type:complete len:291 (-) Transcript_7134:2883-3755(-)
MQCESILFDILEVVDPFGDEILKFITKTFFFECDPGRLQKFVQFSHILFICVPDFVHARNILAHIQVVEFLLLETKVLAFFGNVLSLTLQLGKFLLLLFDELHLTQCLVTGREFQTLWLKLVPVSCESSQFVFETLHLVVYFLTEFGGLVGQILVVCSERVVKVLPFSLDSCRVNISARNTSQQAILFFEFLKFQEDSMFVDIQLLSVLVRLTNLSDTVWILIESLTCLVHECLNTLEVLLGTLSKCFHENISQFLQMFLNGCLYALCGHIETVDFLHIRQTLHLLALLF